VIHENHNFGTLRCRWVGAVHCIRSSHRASLSSSGLACRTLDCAISASGRSRSWRPTAGSADFFSGRTTMASPASAGRHQFRSANQEKE
jgi:hypothetical protein